MQNEAWDRLIEATKKSVCDDGWRVLHALRWASKQPRQPGVEHCPSRFYLLNALRPHGYLPPVNGVCKVHETGPGTYEIITLDVDQAEFVAVLQQFRKTGCAIELDGREHNHRAVAEYDIVEFHHFVIYRIRVIPVMVSATLADV